MSPIIECVPNFSEGRDTAVINQIADAIRSVGGSIRLLHIDPGQAANRTVITFVGHPEDVTEAAFRAAATAARTIDMRRHHGTHPRIGATDVLPLIPLSGITLEECALLARQLARRMADEAGIPCYCYEAAALRPAFRNLADCRRGEYEALQRKLTTSDEQPDFMPPLPSSPISAPPSTLSSSAPPSTPIPAPPSSPSAAAVPSSAATVVNGFAVDIPESIRRSGISVVGARPFLVAVNFNLDTQDVAVAKVIAADVRQKGPAGRPFALSTVKAIGWYIDEYGRAQVSTNLTDIDTTPLHQAFVTISRCAETHGVHVTGTEIIGLVPKRVLTEAGAFFMQQDGSDASAADDDTLMQQAVSHMHLDDLCPFLTEKKVLELLAAL